MPFLLLLLIAPAPAPAQERTGVKHGPEPRQVFTELVKPYRDLSDYTVRIHAKVNMPTIRIPDFSATLYFKKPDKFHVETRRFAPIPRNLGVFNPFQFDPEKNRIEFQRTENLDGMPADLYRLEPRDAKTPIRYYQVWVGGSPKRILQVESVSFQGTRGMVKITHQSVEQSSGKWLLPATVNVHLTFPERAQPPEGLTTQDNPISGGMRRFEEMSGEGNITITYTDWQVNTGLDDSRFEQ